MTRYVSKITGVVYFGEPTWLYSAEDESLTILFGDAPALTVFDVSREDAVSAEAVEGVFENALETAFAERS